MADDGAEREKLIHELRNVQAERQALKHLLTRATDRMEGLVESNCDETEKQNALKDVKRFRRAIT